MDLDLLRRELFRDEGVRLRLYRDLKGIPTIGVGRNLEDPGITIDEAMLLLEHDIERVQEDLDRNLAWWRNLDAVRQRVVANMAFNLGVHGLLGFRATLQAIQLADWERAANEMLASGWAQQVGRRAERLALMMRTGAEPG